MYREMVSDARPIGLEIAENGLIRGKQALGGAERRRLSIRDALSEARKKYCPTLLMYISRNLLSSARKSRMPTIYRYRRKKM